MEPLIETQPIALGNLEALLGPGAGLKMGMAQWECKFSFLSHVRKRLLESLIGITFFLNVFQKIIWSRTYHRTYRFGLFFFFFLRNLCTLECICLIRVFSIMFRENIILIKRKQQPPPKRKKKIITF